MNYNVRLVQDRDYLLRAGGLMVSPAIARLVLGNAAYQLPAHGINQGQGETGGVGVWLAHLAKQASLRFDGMASTLHRLAE